MAVLNTQAKPALRVRTCLGVDLAPGQPCAVAATRSGRRVVFQPASGSPVVGNTPVAAAIPVHSSFLRRLRAPFASPAKAEKVWPSLLDIQLPFPLERAVYQFLVPVRTADGQVETLAVAVRREDLEAWRGTLVQAGLEPWLVDHEGLALWSQSVAEQPLEKQGLRLVCYLGEDRVALVWGRGADLLAASGLRVGMRELVDPQHGAAARQQFAQRAGTFLRAQVVPADVPVQWAWCGPGASRPDHLELLVSALDSIPQASRFTHREPASFLARAVAARAVRIEPTRCSLLPADLAPAGLQRLEKRQARRASLALLAASLALIVVNVAWSLWLDQQRDQLQLVVQTQAAALAETTSVPRGMEVLTAERAMKEKAPAYAPFRAALEPSLLLVLEDVLKEANARKITLDSLQLGPRTLVAKGSAAQRADGEKMAARLLQQGWMAEAQLKEAGAEQRVPFTLKASR